MGWTRVPWGRSLPGSFPGYCGPDQLDPMAWSCAAGSTSSVSAVHPTQRQRRQLTLPDRPAVADPDTWTGLWARAAAVAPGGVGDPAWLATWTTESGTHWRIAWGSQTVYLGQIQVWLWNKWLNYVKFGLDWSFMQKKVRRLIMSNISTECKFEAGNLSASFHIIVPGTSTRPGFWHIFS